MNDTRYEELMVKVADGAATSAEREELMAHVAGKPELQRELEQHQALSQVTEAWMARLEADLLVDRDQADPGRRLERHLGASLVLVGLVVLVVAGPLIALFDPEAPLAIRVGLGLGLAGSAVLILNAVRSRLAERQSDAYTEVIR